MICAVSNGDNAMYCSDRNHPTSLLTFGRIRPILSDRCLSVLCHVCDVDVFVAKRLDRLGCHLVWTMEVGLGPGDTVLDEDPAEKLPHGNGHSSFMQFPPYFYF